MGLQLVPREDILDDAKLTVEGNPTEVSIINFAATLLDDSLRGVRQFCEQHAAVDAVPFDSKTKYMATVVWLDVKLCLQLLEAVNVQCAVEDVIQGRCCGCAVVECYSHFC